jgi:penicillin-binding protein 2
VIGLVALERGLDPNARYFVQRDPRKPDHGCIYLGPRQSIKIEDTAPSRDYDFKLALIHSSNAYFITNGIYVAGIARIIELGRRFHFGESTGLNTRQETKGQFPAPQDTSSGWPLRKTANVCIGQDPVWVTPLQMTVMTAAIANGGTVYWPRLVARLESQAPTTAGQSISLPAGAVRDRIGVSEGSLRILKDAMYADVHSGMDGTGYRADVPGMEICAKTGTAQNQDERGRVKDLTTWFISFAPHEKPRYAVVVMVEKGVSGGGTCGPIVQDIYLAIQKREKNGANTPQTLAHAD